MIVKLYSMHDMPARAFGAVMAFPNDEVARRGVLQVLRGDGEISKFPGDFSLWCLGSMDTDSGVLTPQAPTVVFNCGELLQAQ